MVCQIKYCVQSWSELSVSWPVEQPGFFCAGQSSTNLFRFSGNAHVFELFPGKVPLSSTTCCNSIAVDSGAQIWMNPKDDHGKMNGHISSTALVGLSVRILADTNTHVLLPVVIQSLNNFCVSARQSGKPVLHAKLMVFIWLYLKVH